MVVQYIPVLKGSFLMLATGLMAGKNYQEKKTKIWLITATFFIVAGASVLFVGLYQPSS